METWQQLEIELTEDFGEWKKGQRAFCTADLSDDNDVFAFIVEGVWFAASHKVKDKFRLIQEDKDD
jgi:hypothetical protein